MRDDRDIQRPKPASAPEKGRGPLCGKDRRSATVCPCRHVPTCHGFPTKAFQVAPLVVHLARNSRESVPGVTSCLPPGTESPQKRSRCPSLLPTCHGFSCKSVPGVSSRRPPATESLRKCSRCLFLPSTCHGIPAKVFQVSLPAVHLPRNSRESVPGVTSCLPPATVSPQKCVRCHLLPSTWHGIPAKAFQVSFPAVHLPRNSRESVSGGIFLLPTCHGFPMKAFQVAPLVVHLARNSRESVSGVSSASHLPRQFISSRDVGVFQ